MEKLQKDSIKTNNTTHSLSYKNTFPWKIQTKLSIPRGNPREVSSAFYQLKLGHGYFQSYLQRMGIRKQPLHLWEARNTISSPPHHQRN